MPSSLKSAKRGFFLQLQPVLSQVTDVLFTETDGTLFEMSDQEANEVSSGGREDSQMLVCHLILHVNHVTQRDWI